MDSLVAKAHDMLHFEPNNSKSGPNIELYPGEGLVRVKRWDAKEVDMGEVGSSCATPLVQPPDRHPLPHSSSSSSSLLPIFVLDCGSVGHMVTPLYWGGVYGAGRRPLFRL